MAALFGQLTARDGAARVGPLVKSVLPRLVNRDAQRRLRGRARRAGRQPGARQAGRRADPRDARLSQPGLPRRREPGRDGDQARPDRLLVGARAIRDYAGEHPASAALIVEVAETSLAYD